MSRYTIRLYFGAAFLSCVFWDARADVTMPGIFGDHMVLQQEAKLPVWGWANPGEKVKVTLGKESLDTVAAADGAWRVEFPPRTRPEGDIPQILTIAGRNILSYQDVLIGDVWIASGQSNMAFGILNDDHATEAVAKADQPKIRLFRVPNATSLEPLRGDAIQGSWEVCTPESLKSCGPMGFSAVAYYFGREIVRVTGNPVGLIGTYWGGTPAEAWTSLSGLEKEPRLAVYVETHKKFVESYAEVSQSYPKLKAEYDAANKAWYNGPGKAYYREVAEWEAASRQISEGQPSPPKPKMVVSKPVPPVPPDGGQAAPVTLFNAMVSPLIPYPIKGVIWYQGEANGGPTKGPEYAVLFARLITDWREKWGQGHFPFLFVQLANYQAPAKTPSEGGYPMVREGQLRALSLPATGMAVAIDIGNPWNIHPKNKLDVGLRLALAARHVAYGENLVFSGPIYESMNIEGNKIRLAFTQIGGGLSIDVPPWTSSGKPPSQPTELAGFGIAGNDRKWVWAKAVIEGNTVVVSSDNVSEPVAVRYGWGNCPPCNLYNSEGLPASPFRTDDWEYVPPR